MRVEELEAAPLVGSQRIVVWNHKLAALQRSVQSLEGFGSEDSAGLESECRLLADEFIGVLTSEPFKGIEAREKMSPPPIGPNVLALFGGRLTIDNATKIVTLDGQPHQIDKAEVFHAFLTVARAEGQAIESPEVRKAAKRSKGRLDSVLNKLAPPLRGILKSCTAGRYWITLPPVTDPAGSAKKMRKTRIVDT